MVQYICFRCGFETHRKGNMRHHIVRKIKCLPVVRDIDVTKYSVDILDRNEFCETGSHPDSSHFHPDSSHLHPISSHFEKGVKKFKCAYCDHSYNQNCHLTRHLKTCVTNKINKKIKEQEKEI